MSMKLLLRCASTVVGSGDSLPRHQYNGFRAFTQNEIPRFGVRQQAFSAEKLEKSIHPIICRATSL